VPPQSQQEIEKIRWKAAVAILRLLPTWGRGVYFGSGSGSGGGGEGGEESGREQPGEEGKEEVEEEPSQTGKEEETDIPPVQIEQLSTQVLDVFSDAYANKHLLYSVVELFVVRLIPELAEVGVMEVLGERIG